MNLTFFVSLLSEELRTRYYEEIIKNGQVKEELWKEACEYLEKRYRSIFNVEEHITELLRNLEDVEKSRLMMTIQENNIYLFNKISTKLFSFEDIINMDKYRVKRILLTLDMDTICKAIIGASQRVIDYIQNIFPDINFLEERKKIGSIQVDEILRVQDKIIDEINNKY
ncbi:FliG C-terminal domain-containing protein [Clostridium sp.]|uniref:FliG C-terminal domain-containing protein n=1 Tax=Clostridium sp. TaxID=1506 RepID=UPI0034638A71